MGWVKNFVVTCAIALPATSVNAAVLLNWVEMPISAPAIAANPALATARTFDLLLTLSPPDRMNVAGIVMMPPVGGAFYQHPLGSAQQPSAAAVAAFPDWEFDTWLAVPVGAAFSLFGGFTQGVGLFNTATLNQVWIAQGAVGPSSGTHTVARITSFGGVPSGYAAVYGTVPPTIPTVASIPEPVVTHLISMLVLIGRLRRRGGRRPGRRVETGTHQRACAAKN